MNKEVLVSKITDYLINAHKDYILFISTIGNTTNNAGCDDVNLLLITDNLSYDRNENIMKYIRENFDNCKINIIFTSKKETFGFIDEKEWFRYVSQWDKQLKQTIQIEFLNSTN